MNAPIKTVALCSPTGKFGPHLLQALRTEGFEVTAVLRASSKATFPKDQKVVRVSDSYLEDELVAAFRGRDAVVLSLSFEMLSEQKKFAVASVHAGVKWLIASTYGPNLDDPSFALFPASIMHRQTVDDLKELQKGQTTWSWTSISCGPWPETAIAARAWNIDPKAKTAELVEKGTNTFTTSTREQTALAAARVLKLQPDSAKNNTIFIASFEANMQTWFNAFKQVVGSEGWKVTDIDSKTLLERSQKQLADGDFIHGYMGTALVVCTSAGYKNHYSSFARLANDELGLPREDLVETVRRGLELPDPFAEH